MAKKAVKADHALQHKGKRAPKPEMAMGVDSEMIKKGPNAKGAMRHKEPEGPFREPRKGEQSQVLDHKKKALPLKDAPKGAKGVNGGDKIWDRPKPCGTKNHDGY
jgi:hypothetical protein